MEKRKTIIIGITGHIISDQRITRIANTLTAHNFEVTVYYRPFFKYKSSAKMADTSFRILPVKSLFNNGVLFYAWYNLLLFFKLLFRPADYLYAADSDTLPAFILLSKIKRKPLVFDSHEYFAEVPELSQSPLKKKIWHWVTKAGVKQSKACITVGPELAIVLNKRYGKPFTSVRNVPVSQTSAMAGNSGTPIILYQGALNAGRELELLIDAMKLLPQFRCIIAGEGDLSQALRDRANELSNIEFAGLLTPAELTQITRTCFAGFNLLQASSLSYYYSLSNKYFDYMQAGVPSISSKLPEYMALNTAYNCGVCIDNTVEALASTLQNWLDDKAHYQNLKENAIIASRKMNWENEQQILLNVFTSI